MEQDEGPLPGGVHLLWALHHGRVWIGWCICFIHKQQTESNTVCVGGDLKYF